MKKYSKEDQRLLAVSAAIWAEKVLPLFEEACPADDRPREAIRVCRKWARTGLFRMAEIRGASLGAHAAARHVGAGSPAAMAAHAAGQAVATAHVPQHAYGAAYYALKAIAAANPEAADRLTAAERTRQSRRLPEHLRDEFLKRVVVGKGRNGVVVRVVKGKDF